MPKPPNPLHRFPTPNESSLRTGLTPGGSGFMFLAPSPNSQALFAQLASGGATPSTIDFHRTVMSAATKRANKRCSATFETKPASRPFDPHDNDAANGLFMLTQGRNGAQSTNQFAVTWGATSHAHTAPVVPQNMNTSPQMSIASGGSISSARGVSEGSVASDDSDQTRPNIRGKGKKSPPATNGRRKADEAPAKAPWNKKSKANSGAVTMPEEMDMSDESNMKYDENGTKTNTTDEEKRKNFLERNRASAMKCRQRKKQWLANLRTKVEMLSTENDALTSQITRLREGVVNLKTLLLAHKDCPVTQQQGLHNAFMSQVVEPFNPQMNPYGMDAPMPNQPVMAGQGVQRRFS
ncbi:hypothetical protein EDB80DRAFT_757938 [Ilyonectria destructans]|nr:hypothetical protein EDB80DRAFT_757938 [Ilyonectria destructans]